MTRELWNLLGGLILIGLGLLCLLGYWLSDRNGRSPVEEFIPAAAVLITFGLMATAMFWVDYSNTFPSAYQEAKK